MTADQREWLLNLAALMACYAITLGIGALILFAPEFRAFIWGLFQ